MASSRPREDLDAVSNKIKVALSSSDDSESGASTENDGDSRLPTFSEMAVLHWQLSSTLCTLFQDTTEFISSKFPFYDLINKSYFLNDEKLYEAILFSKVFDSVDEFHADRHRCEGELVWVVEHPYSTHAALICHHRIIYTLSRSSLKMIRENVPRIWAILKNQVGINHIQAFSMAESTQGWSDTPSTSVAHEGSVTDEVKKVMLDELNSLSLVQGLKDQFAFNLKMLLDKEDVDYGHTRLDPLELYSNMAVHSPQESAELKQLAQIMANPEKVTGRNKACVASLAEQVRPNETVRNSGNKIQELKQSLERILAEADVLLAEKFTDVIREDAIFEGISEDEFQQIDDLKMFVVEKLENLTDAIDPYKVL